MKNKKLLMAMSLVCAATLLFAGCSKPTEPTPTPTPGTDAPAPAPTKKLVVGTSADYAPYEFHILDNGVDKIVGFDISIAEEIAKDYGAELEIVDIPFDNLLVQMKSGAVDMVVAAMSSTPDRLLEADFSDIYYQATQCVVVRKEDLDKYPTIGSFSGKSVGAQAGTIQADLVTDEMPGASLVALQKVPDLIMSLKSKKMEGVVLESPVADGYVKAQVDLAIAPFKIGLEEDGTRVAVKKGNTEMLESINKTIARLIEEGKIDQYVVEANELSEKQAG